MYIVRDVTKRNRVRFIDGGFGEDYPNGFNPKKIGSLNQWGTFDIKKCHFVLFCFEENLGSAMTWMAKKIRKHFKTKEKTLKKRMGYYWKPTGDIN